LRRILTEEFWLAHVSVGTRKIADVYTPKANTAKVAIISEYELFGVKYTKKVPSPYEIRKASVLR